MLQAMPAQQSAPDTATIDELSIADEPGAWAGLSFAVTDAVCRIGAVDVRLAGPATGKGLFGFSLRGIACTTSNL